MKENIWHLERNGSKNDSIKNAMMYFGINNIFNHRDDDHATQNGYIVKLILNLVAETAAKLQ